MKSRVKKVARAGRKGLAFYPLWFDVLIFFHEDAIAYFVCFRQGPGI